MAPQDQARLLSDPERAAPWVKAAAEAGLPEAQLRHGQQGAQHQIGRARSFQERRFGQYRTLSARAAVRPAPGTTWFSTAEL